MSKKRCFVIMPFSKTKEYHTEEYWTRHYHLYLRTLIEKNPDLKAFRSQPLRGNIANQIITDLVSSDIVVADLTDLNPNVMWELGIRQSFKQCTITIAETGTEIPFDIKQKSLLFYNGEHLGNENFEALFQQALESCLRNPNDCDSPILEALGGRGTLHSLMQSEESKRKLDALLFEIKTNESIVLSVEKDCKRNGKIRSNKETSDLMMTSDFLTSSAIEHLLTYRYLDVDESIYQDLHDYYGWIITINAKLTNWFAHDVAIEEWINKNFNGFLQRSTNLEKTLISIRNSL